MEADDIADLFGAFGPVAVRGMFGGQGIYADGLMFALQAGGLIYLKADPAFAEALEARGSEPFSYETKTGRRTITGFWRVPEAAMDDADDLADLARQALSVARVAALARPKKPKTAPKKAGAAGKPAAAKASAAAKPAGKARKAPRAPKGV